MMPRIAIIGCGAVTQLRHLPAFHALGMKPTTLIDTDLARARKVAESYGVARTADSYQSEIGQFDAAIVALPHFLHASVCVDLLSQGVHLLVEKPLALTQHECCSIIDKANEKQLVLAVGLIRRFLQVSIWVKWVIDSGLLGEIKSFDFREGSIYAWPMSSDFFIRKQTAGGGVLMDTGAHTLDLLCWWLGDISLSTYRDDSQGGVEADCELRVRARNGAEGVVELSRTRRLRGTAIIRGDRAELEVSLTKNEVLRAPKDLRLQQVGHPSGNQMPQQDMDDLFLLQLKDWLAAIEQKRDPAVRGNEAVRSIALIESCYEQRQLWEYPWMFPEKFAPHTGV